MKNSKRKLSDNTFFSFDSVTVKTEDKRLGGIELSVVKVPGSRETLQRTGAELGFVLRSIGTNRHLNVSLDKSINVMVIIPAQDQADGFDFSWSF